MPSTVHVITLLPLFVSFVCRFSIFLSSLCLEHQLDCNANTPRARQRLVPPPNGRGEISNPVNLLFFHQFRVQSLQLTCPHSPRRSTMIQFPASLMLWPNALGKKISLLWLHYSVPILLSWRYQLQSLPAPPCLPSHSLPVLESAVQASHLATQPAVSPGEPSDPFISSSFSLDARSCKDPCNNLE